MVFSLHKTLNFGYISNIPNITIISLEDGKAKNSRTLPVLNLGSMVVCKVITNVIISVRDAESYMNAKVRLAERSFSMEHV